MPKDDLPPVTVELVLRAYELGAFVMGESRDDMELYFVEPKLRGILPPENFHISRSLARRIRKGGYEIVINGDFEGVVAGCADREETWISPEIERLYRELHQMGYAHSLEIRQEGAVIGAVYGVAMGAAFFAESMFSRARDGSKLALAHLTDRLVYGGFRLMDVQYLTPHLASLGAVEIPRDAYRKMLPEALGAKADFFALPLDSPPQDRLQRITQTS